MLVPVSITFLCFFCFSNKRGGRSNRALHPSERAKRKEEKKHKQVAGSQEIKWGRGASRHTPPPGSEVFLSETLPKHFI